MKQLLILTTLFFSTMSLVANSATAAGNGIMLEPGLYEVVQRQRPSNSIFFGDVGGGRQNLGIYAVYNKNGKTVGFRAFNYSHISNQSDGYTYNCEGTRCGKVTILSPTTISVDSIGGLVLMLEKVSSRICHYEKYADCSSRCKLATRVTCATYNRDGTIADTWTPAAYESDNNSSHMTPHGF